MHLFDSVGRDDIVLEQPQHIDLSNYLLHWRIYQDGNGRKAEIAQTLALPLFAVFVRGDPGATAHLVPQLHEQPLQVRPTGNQARLCERGARAVPVLVLFPLGEYTRLPVCRCMMTLSFAGRRRSLFPVGACLCMPLRTL